MRKLKIWVDTDTPIDSCRPVVDNLLDILDSVFAENSDKISVCLTADEAEKIIAEGKIAAFLGIENGVAIANDLDNLQILKRRAALLGTARLSDTTLVEDAVASSSEKYLREGVYAIGDIVRDALEAQERDRLAEEAMRLERQQELEERPNRAMEIAKKLGKDYCDSARELLANSGDYVFAAEVEVELAKLVWNSSEVYTVPNNYLTLATTNCYRFISYCMWLAGHQARFAYNDVNHGAGGYARIRSICDACLACYHLAIIRYHGCLAGRIISCGKGGQNRSC